MATYAITPTVDRLDYSAGCYLLYSTSGNFGVALPDGCRVAGTVGNVRASKSGLYCCTDSTVDPTRDPPWTSVNYGFINGFTSSISGTIDNELSGVTGTRDYGGQLLGHSSMYGDVTFYINPNSGYRAYGWLWGHGYNYLNYTTGFQAGESIQLNLNSTVSSDHPLWGIIPIERKYYIVHYDGNGATSGSMTDDEFFYGKSYNLTSCGYSKTITCTWDGNGGTLSGAPTVTIANLAFLGWSTTADGEAVYDDCESVSNLTSTAGGSVTLYAKWQGSGNARIPTPARPGYRFVGWYDAPIGGNLISNVAPGIVADHEFAETITLYAHWAENLLVFFDPQGGTIDNDAYSLNYYAGSAYGSLPTANKSGYDFVGWFTAANGGTQVTAETIAPSTRHTLYAHWTPNAEASKIYLYFNQCGGTSYGYGTRLIIKEATPGMAIGDSTALYHIDTMPLTSRANYTFLGWFRGTVSNELITLETIAPDEDMTVYARWQGEPLTISFNANGGVVDESSRQVIAGNQIGRLPEAQWQGYKFDGWFTASEGGTQVTSADYPSGDMTLYAHWSEAVVFDWWSVTIY